MSSPSPAVWARRLAPPGDAVSLRLARMAEARTLRRLRVLERRLRARPKLRRLVSALPPLIAAAPSSLRRRILHGPDLRGFLSEAETWSDMLHRARHGTDANRLFDLVARTEHLTALVPTGRLDAGFPARSRRLALLRLRALEGEASALILGIRLADPPVHGRKPGAPAVLHLRARPDAEQGRPGDRIDLGAFGGTSGALTLRLSPRVRKVRARLTPRALLLRQDQGPEQAFPLGALALAGPLPEGPLPRPERRSVIPGTAIVLTPAVRSTARTLLVGRPLPGLGERLAQGLRLVQLAWPDGAREILCRTAMVVPVLERRLVSYSLAARPGVSFINVVGKRTVDLADDLLHETAHHLLHEAQESIDFLVPGPATEETQAWDSPWRRARRPLHGILHGAFTFLFRAELFTRILAARRRWPAVIDPLLGRGGAAFVARERRKELSMMTRALTDLRRARRDGLLTPAGRALVAGLAAWHRRLLSGGTR
ncbi:MAG TPA: HEXXH motif-containing putative peptide modification protein [Candidatus Polarisedimenticolia bacterium]|nr:HEXXH motif-containing putative peptide modification protein [Candidatus Polarisedimenticolia bacterium]